MKKATVITVAIIAIFAAWTTFWPRMEETPAGPEQTAVVTIHTACPQTKTPQSAPSKVVELTKQPKSIDTPTPTETPRPTQEPTEPPVPSELPIPAETPAPTPTPSEPAHSGYGGYVPGFGWIESQGAGTGTIADSIYENGNKVGIMG